MGGSGSGTSTGGASAGAGTGASRTTRTTTRSMGAWCCSGDGDLGQLHQLELQLVVQGLDLGWDAWVRDDTIHSHSPLREGGLHVLRSLVLDLDEQREHHEHDPGAGEEQHCSHEQQEQHQQLGGRDPVHAPLVVVQHKLVDKHNNFALGLHGLVEHLGQQRGLQVH